MFSAQKNGSEDVPCKDDCIVSLLNAKVQIPIVSRYNIIMFTIHYHAHMIPHQNKWVKHVPFPVPQTIQRESCLSV